MVGYGNGNANAALLQRQVDTFYHVNKFVGSIYNLGMLLDLVIREAAAAVGAEASCIALYDETDQLLHIEYAFGEADAGVKHLAWSWAKGYSVSPRQPRSRCG